jgi:hypothetical protein
MSGKDRLDKVLTVAINPGAFEQEAVAALHKARELVKRDPNLAFDPLPSLDSKDEASFEVEISGVSEFWLPIALNTLSEQAYALGLKSKIISDFATPTTVKVKEVTTVGGNLLALNNREGRIGVAHLVTRRLYAAAGLPAEYDQRDTLREAELQFHTRYDAGRGGGCRTVRNGDQSGGSGKDSSGIHRLREIQSGQPQHGVGRHRFRPPPRGRAFQDDGRGQHGSCALSRTGAGPHRPAGHGERHRPWSLCCVRSLSC